MTTVVALQMIDDPQIGAGMLALPMSEAAVELWAHTPDDLAALCTLAEALKRYAPTCSAEGWGHHRCGKCRGCEVLDALAAVEQLS